MPGTVWLAPEHTGKVVDVRVSDCCLGVRFRGEFVGEHDIVGGDTVYIFRVGGEQVDVTTSKSIEVLEVLS